MRIYGKEIKMVYTAGKITEHKQIKNITQKR